MELAHRRRFFAEELDAVCAFRSPGLLEAFATVPRQRFLPAGPWEVPSVADYMPVEVRHGDATSQAGETFDAILVNAGVTHRVTNGSTR